MTDSSRTRIKTKFKIISALLIGTFLVSYSIVNTRKNHQMRVDARKLNSTISEPIEWIETLSIHMGRRIAAHNDYNDLAYIDNLFKETLKLQGLSSRIVSWSMFSWSNRKNKLVVNALDGIRENPEDLGERQYAWRSKYNPWMLQITKTARGMLSNTVIIPVAVGVSNSRDEFQGAIISGINAKEMINRAEAVVNSGNAFLLVNRDTFHSEPEKIVIASANSPHVAADYDKLPALVELLKDWIDPSGQTPITIKAGKYKFSHYSLIEGYQLAVLVGYNYIEFWINVFTLWMELLIGIGLLVFLGREFGYLKKDDSIS